VGRRRRATLPGVERRVAGVAAGAHDVGGERIVRPRWRARLVRGFVATVLVGQAVLLARGYVDPHKLFAFQPFNESSVWRADVVRVTADGRRVPIDQEWPGGYGWDELVGWGVLERPGAAKHAYSGLGASLDFFVESLDWVADHTPDDHETLYLEASIESWRNTRPQDVRVVRSSLREEAR